MQLRLWSQKSLSEEISQKDTIRMSRKVGRKDPKCLSLWLD